MGLHRREGATTSTLRPDGWRSGRGPARWGVLSREQLGKWTKSLSFRKGSCHAFWWGRSRKEARDGAPC